MAARKRVVSAAVLTALGVSAPTAASADPPARSCPPPFITRTLDVFVNDPPELVTAVNKNEDNFLCTMDFPEESGQPGGNVVDNTAVGP